MKRALIPSFAVLLLMLAASVAQQTNVGRTGAYLIAPPSAPGTNGHVATYDTDGTFAGWAASGAGLLSDVVNDTTPQLGGNLDVNGNQVTSTGDIDAKLGDNAGVNRFIVRDSDNNIAGRINSDGDATFTDVTGLSLTATSYLEVASQSYQLAMIDDGSLGASPTIDWTTGNLHKGTLTAVATPTFTPPSGPTTLSIVLTQGGTGSYTVTWPAAVKWAGGTAPTLSTGVGEIDIVTLMYDGTNYYGTSVLDLQ